MNHKVIEYPEKTLRTLGVEPNVTYTVFKEQGAVGVFDQAGKEIRLHMDGVLKVIPLGLDGSFSGLAPGDTVEFQAKTNLLRLAPDKIDQMGLKVGQKLVVQRGQGEYAGPGSGPYVEVKGQKFYLWSLGGMPYPDDMHAGDILTVETF